MLIVFIFQLYKHVVQIVEKFIKKVILKKKHKTCLHLLLHIINNAGKYPKRLLLFRDWWKQFIFLGFYRFYMLWYLFEYIISSFESSILHSEEEEKMYCKTPPFSNHQLGRKLTMLNLKLIFTGKNNAYFRKYNFYTCLGM